jgi:S1-C subfamily serine protease
MRLLSTLLALTFLAAPTPLMASMNWATIVEQLQQSAVAISYKGAGACTGFVINTVRKLVLTAAHCEGDKDDPQMVNGEPSVVVFRDKKKDLLVVTTAAAEGKPALKIAASNAPLGSTVASYGFGHDLGKPLFRIAHVSQVDVAGVAEGFPSPVMAIDASYVGGQSGGPVVNEAGEVIGIVQFGSPQVGFGVQAETIRDVVGKFLEK